MKIYVSGQITGNTEFESQFQSMENTLNALGYFALNPVVLDRVQSCSTWEEYMKRDIEYLVKCDGVCVLPNWQLSRGAKLEVYIAQQLKIPVYFFNGDNLELLEN